MLVTIYIFTGVLSLLLVGIVVATRRGCSRLRREALREEIECDNGSQVGFDGFSVVCSGVRRLSHIENLLSGDFERYQVVLVIDSCLHAESFEQIVERYSLIKVTPPNTDEFPSALVEELYRSTLRRYRHLVVVSRGSLSQYEDLDAATAVASYDYIIPIGVRGYLREGALPRLSAEMTDLRHRIGSMPQIAQTLDIVPHYIFSRDYIIEQGGFSPHILRRNEGNAHPYKLDLRLFRHRLLKTNGGSWVAPTALAAGAGVTIYVATTLGFTAAVAMLLTLGVGIAALRYYTLLSGEDCSKRAIFYYIIHSLDFFIPKKFRV